jgi:dTDP-4-dehydrorhamnose reductase
LGGVAVEGTTRTKGGKKKYLDLNSTPDPACDLNFDFIIFAAGITKEEDCLNNPALARRINVENTLVYCNLFLKRGSHIIFLSSNNVFSGEIAFPSASDLVMPKNFYGELKLEVEEKLLNSPYAKSVTILRLTKVISRDSRIIKNWLSEIMQGIPIRTYSNVMVSPISPEKIVEACKEIIKGKIRGIVQVGGDEEISMTELALSELAQYGYSANDFEYVEVSAPGSQPFEIDHNSLESNLLN